MIRPVNAPSVSFAGIAKLLGVDFDQDFEVSGISNNASEIETGDIFVALQGAKHHGIDFLSEAIAKGAIAVITDEVGIGKLAPSEVISLPVLKVNDPRQLMGLIAAEIHDNPMPNIFTVGITGTNGKTTVTTLLHQIWQLAGWDSGLVGTVNTQINGEIFPSSHTTPDAASLQALMAAMRERHVRAVAIEVSSHALAQHRTSGAHFSVAGFTNLTQDHLDFHGSMESYFSAKAKLFEYGLSDLAVINVDDKFGQKLAESVNIPVVRISRSNKADWRYEEITEFGASTQIKIRGRDGVLIEGRTTLIGDYNLDNLLMAVAIAVISGVDPIEISANLHKYQGAPGRFERIDVGQKFTAFVDYAHTPDAVTNVLSSARKLAQLSKGNLIAVLGCGGDRDRSKRPLMGRALIAADYPIFTSDNPRSENPEEILAEMVAGISHRGEVIIDRKAAIARAISLAKPGDVVAILGKGHEIGQEINGIKQPFDDRKVLAEAIAGVR